MLSGEYRNIASRWPFRRYVKLPKLPMPFNAMEAFRVKTMFPCVFRRLLRRVGVRLVLRHTRACPLIVVLRNITYVHARQTQSKLWVGLVSPEKGDILMRTLVPV